MADGEEERSPLLGGEKSPEQAPLSPPGYPSSGIPSSIPVGPVPPILPDEQPPPYTPTADGGIPTINCRVCQAPVSLEGKLHQHVVKCTSCNEATPIKTAPPGKKYVRCPCNCLLICKSTSRKIACPRPNCKRIISLDGGGGAMAPPIPPAGGTRVICGHCSMTFMFTSTTNALSRCPHCRKVSSVGSSYARRKCTICVVLGMIFILAGIGVTVGTYELARQQGGIYFAWVGAFIIGILFLIRACYYGTLKVSYIQTSP
ncbi:type 2 phosphatidylinositol 4,5-bisphosphate 4-phosphatase-like isoform X2 [Branchiostoma floridae]|uniref:Phosphatidylinositol-4,5-bisphosphate 4-phosphatase n=1 Tax=Branchiostoma floridae TaxID=7739 RepID=A0A9J7MTJ4_BRAFL|nr:type 2 phosphatidylinositol 4,5-bisphosphate 4-phosphatase-like isoform X2 [Branchiostoma floridae]